MLTWATAGLQAQVLPLKLKQTAGKYFFLLNCFHHLMSDPFRQQTMSSLRCLKEQKKCNFHRFLLPRFLYLWNNSLLGHVHYNLSFCDSEDLVELVLRQPPNREAGTITFELVNAKTHSTITLIEWEEKPFLFYSFNKALCWYSYFSLYFDACLSILSCLFSMMLKFPLRAYEEEGGVPGVK